MTLRVVHCPFNIAGLPWQNVLAQRRRGIDALLVVLERSRLHPEADICLDALQRPLLSRHAVRMAALLRLLPATDVFHFYFGLTLVPMFAQFPILRALRKKSVFHFLGSDIRRKTPAELAYGLRADAQIVGSYDAARWVPDAEVVPVGISLADLEPVPPTDRRRPLVVHAPSSRRNKGTDHVIAACAQLPVELDIVEGVRHDEAKARYRAADIVVDQLNAGWHGVFAVEAMALGKPVVAFLREESLRRTEEAFGVRVPVVSATKETLVDRLRPLIESPELRRRLGTEGRAYVERVHDVERVTDRLLDLYARL